MSFPVDPPCRAPSWAEWACTGAELAQLGRSLGSWEDPCPRAHLSKPSDSGLATEMGPIASPPQFTFCPRGSLAALLSPLGKPF